MSPKMFWPENFYRHHQSAIEKKITSILSSGVYDSLSDTVQILERELSAYFGFQHAVCVASGSDALKIAAQAFILTDSEPLDTVTLPAYSHPCTFEAARHTRYISTKSLPFIAVLDQNPVEYELLLPSPPVFDHQITSLLHIMPQTFGSIPPSFPESFFSGTLRKSLIIDAAHSTGSPQGFSPNCLKPAAVCLSFNPSAPLGSLGHGGAILTDNVALALAAFRLRNHAITERSTLEKHIGMNSHMSAFEAAVVLERLYSLDEDNILRLEYFNRLIEATSRHSPLCRPVNTGLGTPWNFSCILDPSISRPDLIKNLQNRGIPHHIYYPHLCHNFNKYEFDLPEALSLSQRIISFSIDPYQPINQFNITEKLLAQTIAASSRFSKN